MFFIKDIETEMGAGIQKPNRAFFCRDFFDNFKGVVGKSFEVQILSHVGLRHRLGNDRDASLH